MKTQELKWNGATLHIDYAKAKLTRDYDMSKLPANVWIDCAAARHGMEQKFGDAKSGDTFGKEKAEMCDRIYDGMLGGSWNLKGDGGSVEALIERAYQILATQAKQKPAQAKAWYEQYQAMDEEGQAKVKAKPFMKAAIDAARAEKKLGANATDETFNPNA